MKFKQEKIILFLDPHTTISPEELGDKKLYIILSPSLYWVKKLQLPVKSLREIKKLLPSIFEEIVPAGHYSYHAYKTEDGFVAFAYEDKKILKLLEDKKIDVNRVAGFYFAQAEFQNDTNSYKINEKQALLNKDGNVIITPLGWVKGAKEFVLKDHKLHSKPIRLQQYGHIVDMQSVYKIGAMLGVLLVIVVVEIMMTHAKIEKLQKAKEEIFSNYHLPPTMMQNRAILSKYKAIHTQQYHLRELIAFFLHLHLPSGVSLLEIDFHNKQLRVLFSAIDKKQEKYLFRKLLQKEKRVKIEHKNKKTYVEVML
jgi:hypothetical protein